jgi:4-hydroxy-tetrahydrodipicolinate synthase
MRRTRECCGPEFTILSGDDGMTYEMMTDAAIDAAGVISVASNVAPKAVGEMVGLLNQGNHSDAKTLMLKLEPLFGLVTVKTTEKTPFGDVVCRARNPVAYKTLMSILGMPAGGCRQPLGKMTQNGVEVVLEAARKVHANAPDILQPVADFVNVDIGQRLENPENWQELYYPSY